jgi:hypothetical protein
VVFLRPEYAFFALNPDWMENRQAKLKIAYRRNPKNVGRQPTVQENLCRLQQEMQEILGKIEEEMAGSAPQITQIHTD